MIKPQKKKFNLLVTTANSTVSQTFELEKTIVSIKGLLVNSNYNDLLYYRGSQRIEINKDEIFPDGYDSQLLMSGINLPPNERYYDLEGMKPGSGIVRIDYTDADDGRTAFTPYRVSLHLDVLMDK
jgi:hypothetical protein